MAEAHFKFSFERTKFKSRSNWQQREWQRARAFEGGDLIIGAGDRV